MSVLKEAEICFQQVQDSVEMSGPGANNITTNQQSTTHPGPHHLPQLSLLGPQDKHIVSRNKPCSLEKFTPREMTMS